MPTGHLPHFPLSVLMLVSCLTYSVEELSKCSLPPKVESHHVCVEFNEPRYTTMKPSILNQAMIGVNPFVFDQLDSWNTGLKDQIFTPVSLTSGSSEIFQLNDFIGKAVKDYRCTPLHLPSMRTVYNYNSFRDVLSESISFEEGKDKKIGCRLCSDFTSEFSSSSNDQMKLVEHFRRGGEVTIGEVRCQTHAVAVNLNTRPNFTHNFVIAARKIVSAVTNDINTNQKTFSDFVDNFGTHFQDKTLFGSRLVMVKLFTRKAANISEHVERLRCVSSSFTRNLHLISNFHDLALAFSRNVARCENLEDYEDEVSFLGLPRDRILTVGNIALLDQNEDSVEPVPIFRRLKKFSLLFEEDWFECFLPSLDRASVLEFFDNMLLEYKNLHHAASSEVASKIGCGYNSNCSLQEKCIEDNHTPEGYNCVRYCHVKNTCSDNEVCVDDDSLLGYSCLRGCGHTSNCSDYSVCVDDDSLDGYSCRKGCNFTANCPLQKVCVDDGSELGFKCVDPCTLDVCALGESCYAEEHSHRGYICVLSKPGKAAIIGGVRDALPLDSVELVNFWPFDELPFTVFDTAGAIVRDSIYLCGGYQDGAESNTCVKITIISPDNEWNVVSPAPLQMSGHSAVSISWSVIWFIHRNYVVEFDTENENFSTNGLPFDANYKHCSVSNETHVYVIGAGPKKNEIWMISKEAMFFAWHLAGRLKQGRYKHACLWYGSNIMITGGRGVSDDVEIFNTETRDLWAGQNLLTGREGHGMMLLNGKPTVLGGWNETELNTFESYSIEFNQWTQLEKKLDNPNREFCLVELGW